jgi:hypothetical protein
METLGPILGDSLSVGDEGGMRRELEEASPGIEVVLVSAATSYELNQDNAADASPFASQT